MESLVILLPKATAHDDLGLKLLEGEGGEVVIGRMEDDSSFIPQGVLLAVNGVAWPDLRTARMIIAESRGAVELRIAASDLDDAAELELEASAPAAMAAFSVIAPRVRPPPAARRYTVPEPIVEEDPEASASPPLPRNNSHGLDVMATPAQLSAIDGDAVAKMVVKAQAIGVVPGSRTKVLHLRAPPLRKATSSMDFSTPSWRCAAQEPSRSDEREERLQTPPFFECPPEPPPRKSRPRFVTPRGSGRRVAAMAALARAEAEAAAAEAAVAKAEAEVAAATALVEAQAEHSSSCTPPLRPVALRRVTATEETAEAPFLYGPMTQAAASVGCVPSRSRACLLVATRRPWGRLVLTKAAEPEQRQATAKPKLGRFAVRKSLVF